MTAPWELRIYDRQSLVHTQDFTEPLVLGRQDEGEDGPFSRRRTEDNNAWRLVMANREERSISRTHIMLEPLPGDRVRITNRSTTLPLRLNTGRELKPLAAAEEGLPVVMILGKKSVHLQQRNRDDIVLQSLAETPLRPGTVLANFSRLPDLSTLADPDKESKALVRWLQATMGVFQSAASSSDFLTRAAQAVVEIAGLDCGRVLLLTPGGEWKTEAIRSAPGRLHSYEGQASRHILNMVVTLKRTFWQLPETADPLGASLMGVHAVVAAPILDRTGQVIGALYGDRRCDSLAAGPSAAAGPITELEAMLVELLASGISAGLARLEQEQAALAARVQFEQFFTPEFSRQLTEHPDLLDGRDCDITVMFCDIRGFSRISERLGASRTFDWIHATLGMLSDCVRAHHGVLVDYVGDEILSMWGAPDTQPEHARMACQAALDILDRLPELNAQWQPLIGEPIQVSIGINTGKAWVGNVGSKHKFKYGPLGNTVNLGSRVMGATKYLHNHMLVTSSTHRMLDERYPRRRLCTARVVNIAQPVELYELARPGQPSWAELRQGYEEALNAFETRDFRGAARLLGNQLARFPNDEPSLVLLSRSVNAMLDKSGDFDPVWQLPGK
jgi:adenylate cyclase